MIPSPDPLQGGYDILIDLFERVVEIERAAIADVLPVGIVVTYEWPYGQSVFPYVSNRWLPSQSSDLSSDMGFEIQRVGVRLLTANVSDASRIGSMHQQFRGITAMRQAFAGPHGSRLRTPTRPREPWWLAGDLEVSGHDGSTAYSMGGVGNAQSGSQFELSIPIITKRY